MVYYNKKIIFYSNIRNINEAPKSKDRNLPRKKFSVFYGFEGVKSLESIHNHFENIKNILYPFQTFYRLTGRHQLLKTTENKKIHKFRVLAFASEGLK